MFVSNQYMAKSKKSGSKTVKKKELRTHVSQKLESLFKDFESVVGKRKFRRNIKKACKILTTNVSLDKVKLPAEEPAPADQQAQLFDL